MPFVPVEGDEQAVLNGVLCLERACPDFAGVAYLYPLQPGTYALLHAVHALLGGSLIGVYGALTAIGAILYITTMAHVAARILSIRPAFCALGLILAQEMTAASYYANNSAICAGIMGFAFLLALGPSTRGRNAACAVLIALAAWVRLDVLIVSPGVAALAFLTKRNPGQAFRRSVVIAGLSLLLVTLLLLLSGVSPLQSMSTYTARDSDQNWGNLVRLWGVTSSPVMGTATLLGAAYMVWRKEWARAVVVVFSVLPTLLVYGGSFTTTKYLYYALPFALLPAFLLVRDLMVPRKGPGPAAGWVLIILSCVESSIGARTSRPDIRRFDPAPAVHLATIHLPIGRRPVSLFVGEGEILSTHDGFRLRGAGFYAPSVWHREKTRMQQSLQLASTWLLSARGSVVITSDYLAKQLATMVFLSAGATYAGIQALSQDSSSDKTEWRSSGRSFQTVNINLTDNDQSIFRTFSRGHEPVLFLNDRGRADASRLGVSTPEWTILAGDENGLITLYGARLGIGERSNPAR